MGFDVPSTIPALSPYLQPPNVIRGDAVDSLLLRDRYAFATRRRVLFSGGNYTTTQDEYEILYYAIVKTSAATTGNVWVVISGSDVVVRIDEAFGSGATLELGVPSSLGVNSQLLIGLPSDSLCGLVIQVRTSEGTATLYSIYIVEEILTAADLPE